MAHSNNVPIERHTAGRDMMPSHAPGWPLLKTRDFGLLFWGQLTSQIGDSLMRIAFIVMVRVPTDGFGHENGHDRLVANNPALNPGTDRRYVCGPDQQKIDNGRKGCQHRWFFWMKSRPCS
jgi:hypothetical protein